MKFGLTEEGLVTQDCGEARTEFDPQTAFGRFRRGDREVRAVRIPGRFRVGADVCVNGYLVFDGQRLYAISAMTFGNEYAAVDGGVPEGARAA
jgi:hypothetical protein